MDINVPTVACSCCGYLTLPDGGHEFCILCRWFDDWQDDPDAALVLPGPNHPRSLAVARRLFRDTLSALSSDDEFFAEEQELKPEKQRVIEVFDKMAGAVSSAEYIESFVVAQRLLGELKARRQALGDVRRASQ